MFSDFSPSRAGKRSTSRQKPTGSDSLRGAELPHSHAARGNEKRNHTMKTVEEIQTDIEALPHKEYIRLVHWFSERDWKAWDKKIEMDSKSGKLDFLIEEALAEKKAGKLKDL